MAETNTTVTETNKAENGSTGAYGGDPTQAVKGGANLPEKAVSTSEPEQTAKTFTQAELDAIVKQRLERQAKGHPSKEEMEAFRKWQDSRKTAEQLSQEKISAAENGRADAEKKLTLHNNDRINSLFNRHIVRYLCHGKGDNVIYSLGSYAPGISAALSLSRRKLLLSVRPAIFCSGYLFL